MYFSTDKKLIIMPDWYHPFDAACAVRIFRRCGATDFHKYMESKGFTQMQRIYLANALEAKKPKCFERMAHINYPAEVMNKIHHIWCWQKNPIRRERKILIAILEG